MKVAFKPNSTKYATKYENNTEYYNCATVYNVGKTGDATKEVFNKVSSYAWFHDDLSFPFWQSPFLRK